MSGRQLTHSKSSSYSRRFQIDPLRPSDIKPQSSIGNQARLYELNKIGSYLKNDRPILSQQRRKIIEEKLQLDKQAEIVTNQRLKDENLFINYLYNPFNELQKKTSESYFVRPAGGSRTALKEVSRERLENTGRYENIVQAINSIKKNNFMRNDQPLHKITKHASNFSHKILQNARKMNLNYRKEEQKQEKREVEIRQPDLDEIVAMHDVSFYHQQTSINIFQVMRGNTQSIVSNSILDRHYFSYNSMVDKIGEVKFPTYRELSRVGRLFVRDLNSKKDNRLDLLTSYETTFKITELRFQDLLSIASGRFTPTLVYKTINEGQFRQQKSPNSSEISNADIYYNQNTNQAIMNFEDRNNNRQQVIDYLRLPNTLQQQKYQQKCNKIYSKVQKQMKEKTELCKNTINDKNLHSKMMREINNDLQFFVDMDKRGPIETDRLIRINKTTKNRREGIKIRKLLDAIVVKNDQEALIRELLDGSSKK